MLKLVTVSQFIVSHRYLNKDFVLHTVFLDSKHTFIVLIYGFMYRKSKLIQEFCFQLNPYSERRKKQSVLLKSFQYTRFGRFHPKAVLLKKNFLKSNIFFSLLVSSRNLRKRPDFYKHSHPIIQD